MPRKFWIGLIIILIIYTTYHFLFVETSYVHEHCPRKIRHLIKLVILVSVYTIGLNHLEYNGILWMKIIWHITHIVGIFLLSAMGLYDWLFYPLTLPTKLILISINEFLIAPTLYVGMGILNTFLIPQKPYKK